MQRCTQTEEENALALLKVLAQGSRELEQGKFRDAEDVFADLEIEKCHKLSPRT